MPNLNPRQETFAVYVASGKAHKQAAALAGYSARSAGCLGAQLAKLPHVAARIAELRDARAKSVETRESMLAQMNFALVDLQPVTLCGLNGMPIGFFLPLPPATKTTRL